MLLTLLSILLALLLLSSAFLSASETALFSLSSLQLRSYKRSNDLRLKAIGILMERPKDVLVTILMLNVLANILVQNTVASLFSGSSGWAIKVGLPLFLTLFCGELLPKSMAMPNNVKISYVVTPGIARIARWLGPLRKLLTQMTDYIARFFLYIMRKEEEITPNALRHVLKSSEKSGVLLREEGRLIGGALDLQQMRAKERMRPREEILFYDMREPIAELTRLFVEQQISRIPVCEGDLENLRGILSLGDFFRAGPEIASSRDLISHLQKPYYVPETINAFALLTTLRQREIDLAIAVDEYGSISGLITQEDLIEGIVGEIADVRDTKSLYTRSGDDVIIASGKMELSEFRELFGKEVGVRGEALTIGGWLTEQLGTIPQTGSEYATDDFLFYVLAADPNRVRRVYIRRLR